MFAVEVKRGESYEVRAYCSTLEAAWASATVAAAGGKMVRVVDETGAMMTAPQMNKGGEQAA